MVSTLRESSNSRPAGRPSLKTFLFLPILFGVLAGRGPLPVALAQTRTANASAADKVLHELYSAFGIGPGGSRTLVSTASTNSTVISTSSSSPSQNQTQTPSSSQTQTSSPSRNPTSQARTQTQAPKTPSQGQGGSGFRAAPGAPPDGPASSPNGTSTGSGRRDHGRAVFANFVVRNAEKYTVDCWIEGIKLAASAGFDALALSVGNEPWEARQVANAFWAASRFNNATETAKATDASRAGFKLFLSFNMTSLPCSSAQDASVLQQYIRTYANYTDYFRYNGRMLVSTFAGEGCVFGENSVDDGWKYALRPKSANASVVPEVWFVPAFFMPPDTLSNSTAIDGLFNWNSAWPSGGQISTPFAADQSYISALGGKTYMSAVSLWSWVQRDRNAHHSACGPDARSFGARWESLVKNRDSVSLVEVVTWGDTFAGSDVGPSGEPFSSSCGAEVAESRNTSQSDSIQGQERSGGILEQVAPLMKYYVEAFKSGSYPPVTRDEVFLWMEVHPRKGNCSASKEGLVRADGKGWIQDRVSAYALLSAPGNATLTCGPWSIGTAVPCGLSKLGLALDGSDCCKADATLMRNSKTTTIVEQEVVVDMTLIRRWIPLSADWESDEDLAVLVPVPVA